MNHWAGAFPASSSIHPHWLYFRDRVGRAFGFGVDGAFGYWVDESAGFPAGGIALGGGDLECLYEVGEEVCFPVCWAEGSAAEEVLCFADEAAVEGGIQSLPAVDDGVPSVVEKGVGGQAVAFAVVDSGVGGEQVPQVIIAPECEGHGVVDGEFFWQVPVAPDAAPVGHGGKVGACIGDVAAGVGDGQQAVDDLAGLECAFVDLLGEARPAQYCGILYPTAHQAELAPQGGVHKNRLCWLVVL